MAMMHEERNTQQESFSPHNAISPELHALFEQLNPQDVEQFYRAYQLWTTQRHIAQLNAQIAELQQQRDRNTACIQRVQPSAIALSVLAQLQAHGVEDIDLLDRMLERGEEWLDHTMELLTRCEAMDMIQGDYTSWCEHALEGAYDWIDSMTEAQAVPEEAITADETTIEQTEALLLHKLMSDEETQPELASVVATPSSENEPIHEPTPTTSDELIASGEEEVPPEMGAAVEFALDEPTVADEQSAAGEQPIDEAAEMTTARGKITGPLQPKITGPLQAEEEIASQIQEEPAATVADEVEAVQPPEDEAETASQAQGEAETVAANEVEVAVQPPENETETVPQAQVEPEVAVADEGETITTSENEAEISSQAQEEFGAVANEIEATVQPPEDDAETAPQTQGEPEAAADEIEATVRPPEDDATMHVQDEAETIPAPENQLTPETQPEDIEAIQQAEDAAAVPLLEDEASPQAQDETTIIEEHVSKEEETSMEHPTETLAIVHREVKAAPPDNTVEDQSQEEATQPLDEHPTLDLPYHEEQTQTNADDHTLPPIGEQQSPTPINDQQPSPELLDGRSQSPEPVNESQQLEPLGEHPQQPAAIDNHQEPSSEPINDQPQQPEPVLTAATTAPYDKVSTTAPKAQQAKKKKRGWFSWLFGR
jgi:hypothetical protein